MFTQAGDPALAHRKQLCGQSRALGFGVEPLRRERFRQRLGSKIREHSFYFRCCMNMHLPQCARIGEHNPAMRGELEINSRGGRAKTDIRDRPEIVGLLQPEPEQGRGTPAGGGKPRERKTASAL